MLGNYARNVIKLTWKSSHPDNLKPKVYGQYFTYLSTNCPPPKYSRNPADLRPKFKFKIKISYSNKTI